MNGFPQLHEVTKVLADKSRLDILTILMDNRFHTVSELARKVKLKSHTVSYHLKKLNEMEWVSYYKQGKNSYYKLTSDEVAHLLENMMNISPIKEVNSLRKYEEYNKLKHGRTCYKHLAGVIGVDFLNNLIKYEYITLQMNAIHLSVKGEEFFENLGLDIASIKKQSGEFIKPCLDWTERLFHLSGNLGKAFLNLCIDGGYVLQNSTDRSVTLSKDGEEFFSKLFAESA